MNLRYVSNGVETEWAVGQGIGIDQDESSARITQHHGRDRGWNHRLSDDSPAGDAKRAFFAGYRLHSPDYRYQPG